MARGSTRALVTIAVVLLGCGQSAKGPVGGGAGGDQPQGGSGGAGGAGGAGSSGGQPGPDAAADVASGPDVAAALDLAGPDQLSAGADRPPSNGPAKIVLIAGGGNGGDGTPAAMAKLSQPFGVATDPMTGELYIAEYSGHVRRIDDKGIISTVAGAGAPGPGGKITFTNPHDLLFQPGTRNLFIADTLASRVLKMDAATGAIVPFAGSGTPVAPGLTKTFHLSFDKTGQHLYVTDNGGGKVDIIDLQSNAVTTVDVGAGPRAIAVDSKRNLYVSNNNAVMRKFDPMGGSSVAVGGLNAPKHLAIDGEDNVIICDTEIHTIRKLVPGAMAAVKIAGTGAAGTGTLGGAPELAAFNRPHGVFVDAQGRIYIADSDNNRVLRIEQ
jgi:YVTN family beta-propeller protein